jgi:phosphotransferase system HPr (HPr) family protein
MKTELDYEGEVVAGRDYPFTVVGPGGLACRPSAVIVLALQNMTGSIVISRDARVVNARSVLGIMTLEMSCGRTGYLRFDETQPAQPLARTRELIQIMEADDEK